MSFPTNRKNFREELGLEIWNSGRFAFGRGYYSNVCVYVPYFLDGILKVFTIDIPQYEYKIYAKELKEYYSTNDLRIFSVVIPYVENGTNIDDYYVLLEEESSIKERLRDTFFFQDKQLNKLMKNVRFDITKNMHDNIYLKA